jgi:hypothetical protein
MPQGTAVYELIWTFEATGDFSIKKTIASDAVRVFGNYGDANVQKYTSIFEKYFAISYYLPEDE